MTQGVKGSPPKSEDLSLDPQHSPKWQLGAVASLETWRGGSKARLPGASPLATLLHLEDLSDFHTLLQNPSIHMTPSLSCGVHSLNSPFPTHLFS